MPDRWYDAAKIPQETLAMIALLDDVDVRDATMVTLHERHRELSKSYSGPAPTQCKSWGESRAYFAAIEKECDAIKKAAREKWFGGCHNHPMSCTRGCWGNVDLFPRK